MQLDYTIQSPLQRKKLVEQILETTPENQLTPRYLQILANYLIFAMTKEEKKSHQINTDNRLVTINKRETSFQGLVTKFEAGEDSLYHMIANDKNILLTPKISITEQDLADIPALRELRASIAQIEQQLKHATGHKRFYLKRQLIQMRQDQYVIKMAYKPPITCLNAIKNFRSLIINDNIDFQNDTIIDHSLISLMNPMHVSAILQNYSALKEEAYGNFSADGYYLLQDLEYLIDNTLKQKYPHLFSILIYKIDKKTNQEIQSLLLHQHNLHYSIEYISLLWRKKIPKLLTEEAEKKYLDWYFTNQNKGNWKKCSKCGQIKLAHSLFFPKNKSSKDGFYSICKECRKRKYHQNSHKKQAPVIIKFIPFKPPLQKGDV